MLALKLQIEIIHLKNNPVSVSRGTQPPTTAGDVTMSSVPTDLVTDLLGQLFDLLISQIPLEASSSRLSNPSIVDISRKRMLSSLDASHSPGYGQKSLVLQSNGSKLAPDVHDCRLASLVRNCGEDVTPRIRERGDEVDFSRLERGEGPDGIAEFCRKLREKFESVKGDGIGDLEGGRC
jgi:hypothetical protein